MEKGLYRHTCICNGRYIMPFRSNRGSAFAFRKDVICSKYDYMVTDVHNTVDTSFKGHPCLGHLCNYGNANVSYLEVYKWGHQGLSKNDPRFH